MSTWSEPSAVEIRVGLEIGAYAPAELEVSTEDQSDMPPEAADCSEIPLTAAV